MPDGDGQGGHFTYVDPANTGRQREMEAVATAHLERIGALCLPPARSFTARNEGWPVEASVVMPVRNRCRTVGEAIESALGQTAPFSFNVLVVDNHSTDGTTEIIRQRAEHEPRLVQIVPQATELGIGGCWNTAVNSVCCGRFVCQLDSDDLYAGDSALARMIELLQQGCGMAVGSYRLVNFALKDIPPGIVDHREWTPENGRNNLLRVQGIGAPRGFATELLRQHPFPDVSYGEDYAVALRISRDYRVGRIYEPLYLCRRWEGNSDAQLPVEQANRFALYKDSLRTQEIEQRRLQNQTLSPGRP
jgi:glycosyltransferase involved in cell wall biosynthesis